MVGLIVAVLILKGAAELLIDLLRSSDQEELDLSKYGFQRLDRHRHRQFVRWFLFEIEKERITNRGEMFKEAYAVDDSSTDKPQASESSFVLRLTPAGKSELQRALSDNWSISFSGYRSLLVRSLFAALFFSVLFTAGRGIIILLNKWIVPLETWAAFTPIHISAFIIGLVLFYHGRMISHRAAHAIHHAREKISGRSEKPRYLITGGPFARRRHPMYTGHLLITIGVVIALHSVYALAWSALAVIVQLTGAFYEEQRLQRWFPQKYPEYRRKVKRRFLSAPQWVIIAVIYLAAWAGIFF
ncbi:MAG: methyltransferase family protein [Spirochaetota bacterium]